MKTITKNDGDISLYIFEDNKELDINAKTIIVGEPVEFIIGDYNSSNSTLHENVDSPDDWVSHKYSFDGSTWTASEAYKIAIDRIKDHYP